MLVSKGVLSPGRLLTVSAKLDALGAGRRAHGQQTPGDKTPFDTTQILLPGVEFYACFNFASPWKETMQGVEFTTIIDNSETLHHWLFYQSPLGTTDGTYSYCLGTHPGQALITGWAPGNDGLRLPPDVGLELPPPTGSYVLELHYSNPTLKPFLDRSGVRICATNKFRPKTGFHHLGPAQRRSTLPRDGAGDGERQVRSASQGPRPQPTPFTSSTRGRTCTSRAPAW